MKLSDDSGGEIKSGRISSTIRPADATDVPIFLDIIDKLDDLALLSGPRHLDGSCGFRQPLSKDEFGICFRSPAGPLGYRYTSVIELDGRVAGFGVMVPLERLQGVLLGPVLPFEVAKARYGDDLSTVVDLQLFVVDPALHHVRPSIPLVRWCLAEARRQGYRHMLVQRWDRHVRSASFFEKYGGMHPFHAVEARFDDDTLDAFTFIDRRLDDVEIPS